MHDHHGNAADESAGVDLLPLWLQVLWALVMGAVLAQHLIAGGFGRGVDRAVSGAHAILAAGMLYMCLPWTNAPLQPDVMVTAFCALLLLTLTVLAAGWVVTGSLQLTGVQLTIDVAAMAYMSSMTTGGVSAITHALVTYYGVSALMWTRRTSLPRAARAGHTAMAAAMAYMFLAMGSGSGWLLICGVVACCVPRYRNLSRPTRTLETCATTR